MKKLGLGFGLLVFVLLYVSESSTPHLVVNGKTAVSRPVASANYALSDVDRLRAASSKAISLIQKSQQDWLKKETCSSCHHQLLTEIPVSMARTRGLALDEQTARTVTAASFAFLQDLDAIAQGSEYIDVTFDALTLVTADFAGIAPSASTAFSAGFIASQQQTDGGWRTIDQRPPQSHSRFGVTAASIRAVQLYLPDTLKREKALRVQRARQWLTRNRPASTEDRTFQLLGLKWTGASKPEIRAAANELLSQQRPDGGWSQISRLDSDAYATGQVLFALKQAAGVDPRSSAFQRGIQFLLSTQKTDGSWLVKTRLHPPAPLSPPYFETTFPYGRDQFVSIMATTWAASALLSAIPEEANAGLSRNRQVAVGNDWTDVAVSGSAAQLRKLLDSGMKPDAKTSRGTTALMLASRDAEKVKLLLDRGADVTARAASGFTAIMVAARHRNNAEVLRMLLKKGATVNAEPGVEVRNNSSAAFFAIASGDTTMVELLADAGAKLDQSMTLLGRIPTNPFMYVAFTGNSSMVDYLIRKGFNANEVDSEGIPVLSWATIGNHLETINVLLTKGASVNQKDKLGMTPLLYAASIDFGDTTVIQRLIAAGAELKTRTREGKTALDLATDYKHGSMVGLLSKRSN